MLFFYVSWLFVMNVLKKPKSFPIWIVMVFIVYMPLLRQILLFKLGHIID